MKKALLSLKKPSVFIPIVLGVALIVALLSFSDIHKVLQLLSGFQRLDLLFYLLLMIVYEFVRGFQWSYSLKRLELHIPLSAQIFAFALSEVTKVLPIGNYFQNYLLQQSEGADFGETSAATTLIILEEVVVCLAGVVILGLGSWTSWLRPLILVGSAITVAVVWLLARFHHPGHRPEWVKRHKSLQTVADEFGRFREGAVDLLHPSALLITLACSATYLVVGGAALYVVTLGLNIPNVTFTEALAVYFFSLAVALMLPIPVDVGVIEISGVGAFAAIGVVRDSAIGAVFANRILSILASIAIAIVVVLILHDEARKLIYYMKQGGKNNAESNAEHQANSDDAASGGNASDRRADARNGSSGAGRDGSRDMRDAGRDASRDSPRDVRAAGG